MLCKVVTSLSCCSSCVQTQRVGQCRLIIYDIPVRGVAYIRIYDVLCKQNDFQWVTVEDAHCLLIRKCDEADQSRAHDQEGRLNSTRSRLVARLDRRIVESVVWETWDTQSDNVVGAFVVELWVPVLHVSPSAVSKKLNDHQHQAVRVGNTIGWSGIHECRASSNVLTTWQNVT